MSTTDLDGSGSQPQFSYVVRMPSTSVSPVDMSSGGATGATAGGDTETSLSSSSANMSSRRMSEDKQRKDR